MPILAVGAAVVSTVIAGSTIAATGIAAISVIGALEAVTAIGATLGAIGAVTKNKDLQTAGMALGIVGGIGSLASSAGLLGDASAPLFGTSAAASTADAGTAAASDSAVMSSDDTLAAAYGGTGAAGAGAGSGADLVDTFAGNAPTGMPSTLPGATPPSTGIINQPAGGVAGTSGSSGASATPAATPGAAPAPTAAASTNVTPGASKAATTGLLGWAENHPSVTLGAIQAAGSFLSGATSTLTPAQVAALNAQASSNQAAAALSEQQRANIAMPKAVASSTPVTGQPAPLIAPVPGLINQAPQRAGMSA